MYLMATIELQCPKCGQKFAWCNGGGIGFRSQMYPTCPHCGHEAMAGKFKNCGLPSGSIMIKSLVF